MFHVALWGRDLRNFRNQQSDLISSGIQPDKEDLRKLLIDFAEEVVTLQVCSVKLWFH